MTRDEAYAELMRRLEASLAAGNDFCIGEAHVRTLLDDFRSNTAVEMRVETPLTTNDK